MIGFHKDCSFRDSCYKRVVLRPRRKTKGSLYPTGEDFSRDTGVTYVVPTVRTPRPASLLSLQDGPSRYPVRTGQD